MYHDKELGAVVDIWNGSFGSQDNFKRAINHWLLLLEQTKSQKALTDLSNMVGSFDGSRDWMFKEIVPKAVKLGWRYHAMVQPKNVFSKLSVKDYSVNLSGVEIYNFGDATAAKDWLTSRIIHS